jgi:hypothetical protein
MRLHFAVLCLLVTTVGCGSNMAPVSGTVMLDGKPLANATVVFEPISNEPNPGPGSIGTTNAKGEFSLQLMTGKGQGAVVGKHKVSITAYEGGGEAPSSSPDAVFRKPLVPTMYNAESKLTFEVPSGGTTSANFFLESSPRAGK